MLLSGTTTAALMEYAKSGPRTIYMIAVDVCVEHADAGLVLACR